MIFFIFFLYKLTFIFFSLCTCSGAQELLKVSPDALF